jgi:hypothetical protein
MLLIYAVIEFGWYFVRYEAATGAANNITQAIIQNPTAISYASEVNAGAGIVGPFNTGSNYICANSYTTLAAAQAGGCSNGQWTTGAPAGIAQGSGAPYYVAVTVYAQPASLTGMVNEILPKGTSITRSIVTPVPNTTVGGGGLPAGCGAGQSITYNGTAWVCNTLSYCAAGQYLSSSGCANIPTCTTGQTLTFNGSTLSCTNLGSFGGSYEEDTTCAGGPTLSCIVKNPITGKCSCPSGYNGIAVTVPTGNPCAQGYGGSIITYVLAVCEQ